MSILNMLHYNRQKSARIKQASERASYKNRSVYSLTPIPEIKKKYISYISAKDKRRKKRYKSCECETRIERYDKDPSITILRIKYADSDTHEDMNKQQALIKQNTIQSEEQQEKDNQLPYIKYKKYLSPQKQLLEMGYNPDHRLYSEIYIDKVEQKKYNYLNKMEALKRQLENPSPDTHYAKITKNRIQIKILGEQIRRKRERELLRSQQKKGRKLLEQLLLRNT